MDKTLGQIAHEAGEIRGNWARHWATMGPTQRAEWEAIAAAVAAAVKEEDAKLCDGLAVSIGVHCAAAIRASIKEVK